MLLLMLSYQNFSIPGAQLRRYLPEPVKRHYSETRVIEAGVLPAQAPTDIRESAPARPPSYDQLVGQRYASLQAPAHANSIEGAGTQWAERELRPYLAEYESQLVAGVNHLFQKATTGSPAEYAGLEKRFADGVLDLLMEWMKKRAY